MENTLPTLLAETGSRGVSLSLRSRLLSRADTLGWIAECKHDPQFSRLYVNLNCLKNHYQ